MPCLSSLTPLIALMLVAAALSAVSGKASEVLADLLAVAVGLLGPLVVSFEIARRWGRAADWFRFATALCWCQWAAPVAFVFMLFAMTLLLVAGVPVQAATGCVEAGVIAYGLWLHWFLAKHALRLSGWRATALVAIISTASFVLVSIPTMVEGFIAG